MLLRQEMRNSLQIKQIDTFIRDPNGMSGCAEGVDFAKDGSCKSQHIGHGRKSNLNQRLHTCLADRKANFQH